MIVAGVLAKIRQKLGCPMKTNVGHRNCTYYLNSEKKSQKTPANEIKIAELRKTDYLQRKEENK